MICVFRSVRIKNGKRRVWCHARFVVDAKNVARAGSSKDPRLGTIRTLKRNNFIIYTLPPLSLQRLPPIDRVETAHAYAKTRNFEPP